MKERPIPARRRSTSSPDPRVFKLPREQSLAKDMCRACSIPGRIRESRAGVDLERLHAHLLRGGYYA